MALLEAEPFFYPRFSTCTSETETVVRPISLGIDAFGVDSLLGSLGDFVNRAANCQVVICQVVIVAGGLCVRQDMCRFCRV